eukprot:6706450-Alexandrium_andersonii.AAC.1
MARVEEPFEPLRPLTSGIRLVSRRLGPSSALQERAVPLGQQPPLRVLPRAEVVQLAVAVLPLSTRGNT